MKCANQALFHFSCFIKEIALCFLFCSKGLDILMPPPKNLRDVLAFEEKKNLLKDLSQLNTTGL